MSPRIATVIALTFLIILPVAARAESGREVIVDHYLHARAQAGDLIPSGQFDDAESNPEHYLSHEIEETGTVNGFVVTDTGRIALVSVGDDSISIELPKSLDDADWIEPGTSIRMLLSLQPQTAVSNRAKPVLMAAAPDFDVSVADQAVQRRGAAIRMQLSSRNLTGTQDGISPAISLTGGHPDRVLSPQTQRVYGSYRDFIRGMNRRLTEAQVDHITSSILYYSDLYQIDPRLIVAMIIAESGFDVNSTSNTGAMGLGQLMPSTAREMGLTNAYDPEQNISAATRILRGHLDDYGGAPTNDGIVPFDQIALTMAAYNAGPGAVRKYHGVPPYRETQRYVAKVAALYRDMCGTGN